MEIGEEERYAAGALFTLALHLTQVEYGAGGDGALESAWGAGDEGELEEEVRRAEEHREPSQAVWAAYWGFDSCGPGGILDRLFSALRIPQKSWGGLKRLPEVGGISYERRHSYMHLVSNFLQVLDSTLPTAHLISQNYRPSAPAEPSGVGPARHVGYLPQVDDMLGLHPDATAHNMLRSDAHESPKAVGTGQGDSQDPFAASSQALQMKSDSMAGSAAQQQEQPKHRSPLRKGESIAQLNSTAAKQREAELLLDDSDSDMEADVVFAHVMARHYGMHTRRKSLQPAEQIQRTALAETSLQDTHSEAVEPHSSHAATSLSGEGQCCVSTADKKEHEQQSLSLGMHERPAAGAESLPAAQHVSAEEFGRDSHTAQHVPAETSTSDLQTMQLVPAGPDKAGADGAVLGAPGEAGANGAVLHLSGAPSLQKSTSQARGKKPSQKAVAAMWELLESSIAPQLQLDTGHEADGGKPEHLPRVRWYDARVRTALRKVASWLNVPWPAVGNFEHLLAYQVLLPSQPGDSKKNSNAWEQGLWAAKVGATTVGIGALFAITGGLAAPAIAAGIGAAVSLAGGGAAAAAGASGFLATTVGAATVMSSMGVAGGSYAGAHMARRIGGVKELGFWEVNKTTLQDVHEVAPSQEEMQAAVDAKASAEAKATPQDDKAKAEALSSSEPGKSQASEPGWVTNWEDSKPSSQAGHVQESKAELPRTFGPMQSQNLDGFLQSTSSSAPKQEKKHARTGSVAMELKEMSSLKREDLDLDTYVKPEAPAEIDPGHLDAGHLTFSAIPRPATPPLVVTESKSATGIRSSGSAKAGTPAREFASETSQDKPGARSNEFETKEKGSQDSKASKGTGDKERRFWGGGAKHGSSASLDSAASGGSQKPTAASKDPNKRWLWKPKWKEPPLLLAPISPNSRPDDMRMSLMIGVSGWIGERKDYLKCWSKLEAPDSEVFSLVWESKALLALNSAIGSFMTQQAYQEVAKWAITHFFYTGLVAALATPWILVSFSQMIDHAWAVALNRAQKAGILLAHILMSGAHGDRPVTLVGYSMGARLIFHCLLELCRYSAKGIVEHVVVMGAPVSTRLERWAMARSVVAGRFVNAYSRRDWMLGLIYRGANGFIKGAGGLCPLNCTGIENINLTSIIAGHFDYIAKMEEILELVAIQSSR